MTTKPIKFRLVRVATVEFATTIENVDLNQPHSKVNVQVHYFLSEPEKLIGIRLIIQYSQQEDKTFIKLGLDNAFQIEDSTWSEMKQEESFVIPRDFAMHMVVLAIGTARGVIHAKTENSPLNQFLLPTINVTEIVKEDIKLNWNQFEKV